MVVGCGADRGVVAATVRERHGKQAQAESKFFPIDGEKVSPFDASFWVTGDRVLLSAGMCAVCAHSVLFLRVHGIFKELAWRVPATKPRPPRVIKC